MNVILIFGGTGQAGRRVVEAAAKAENTKVVIFVRSPEKVDADMKDKVEIVKGDLLDETAVATAIKSAKPTAIIVASSLPFGSKIVDLNKIFVPYALKALKEDGRLKDCKLIYLGGGFSVGKGEQLSFGMRILGTVVGSLLRFSAKTADNNNTFAFIQDYAESDPELNYTLVRLAQVSEGASKGKLTHLFGTGLGDAVTFTDAGTYLVELALDNSTVRNKVVALQYVK